MRILLTNDDGVDSAGLLALHTALAPQHHVDIIAPNRNWSISGHNRTMDNPLRVTKITLRDGTEAFSTDGSPADCVALAALGFLPQKPELVVSGINQGFNLGTDVTYSGTVAAAMESVINGMPAIAVSADTKPVWPIDVAAAAVARLVEQVSERGLAADILLNMNVPSLSHEEIKGIRITTLGKRVYQDQLVQRVDLRGRNYYWMGGNEIENHPGEGTDVEAVEEGYTSITPIHMDLTNHKLLDTLRTWDLRF